MAGISWSSVIARILWTMLQLCLASAVYTISLHNCTNSDPPCILHDIVTQERCVGQKAIAMIQFWLTREILHNLRYNDIAIKIKDSTMMRGSEIQAGFYDDEADKARWDPSILITDRHLMYRVANNNLQTKDEVHSHFTLQVGEEILLTNYSTMFKVNKCTKGTDALNPSTTKPMQGTNRKPTEMEPTTSHATSPDVVDSKGNDNQEIVVSNAKVLGQSQQLDSTSLVLTVFTLIMVFLILVKIYRKSIKKCFTFLGCSIKSKSPSSANVELRDVTSSNSIADNPREPHSTDKSLTENLDIQPTVARKWTSYLSLPPSDEGPTTSQHVETTEMDMQNTTCDKEQFKPEEQTLLSSDSNV